MPTPRLPNHQKKGLLRPHAKASCPRAISSGHLNFSLVNLKRSWVAVDGELHCTVSTDVREGHGLPEPVAASAFGLAGHGTGSFLQPSLTPSTKPRISRAGKSSVRLPAKSPSEGVTAAPPFPRH